MDKLLVRPGGSLVNGHTLVAQTVEMSQNSKLQLSGYIVGNVVNKGTMTLDG